VRTKEGLLCDDQLAATVAEVMEYPAPETPASAGSRTRSGE